MFVWTQNERPLQHNNKDICRGVDAIEINFDQLSLKAKVSRLEYLYCIV